MKTIFLVDDSATILLSISNILAKAGYATEKAASGEEAMKKFNAGVKVDLLITDLNMPGMNVPMTSDLANEPIGGWRQYTMSSTTGAWLAQHFYLHWQYSRDGAFLRDRAYPYLRDVATFLEAVTAERDGEGKRTLPLSS